MSDYNRNVTAGPFGQAAGQTTVAVDAGLRAYMLRVAMASAAGSTAIRISAFKLRSAACRDSCAAAPVIFRTAAAISLPTPRG